MFGTALLVMSRGLAVWTDFDGTVDDGPSWQLRHRNYTTTTYCVGPKVMQAGGLHRVPSVSPEGEAVPVLHDKAAERASLLRR